MITRLAPGEEITRDRVNQLIDGLNAVRPAPSSLPMEQTTAGTRISVPRRPREFYAILKETFERPRDYLTGDVKGGEYEWARVLLSPDGKMAELEAETLGSYYDLSTGFLYNPAYELNGNGKVPIGTIVRMRPDTPIQDDERGFLRRYVFGEVRGVNRIWVKAQDNWMKVWGQAMDWVYVRQCNMEGDHERGEQFTLWLPNAANMVPNVVKGDVLAAGQMDANANVDPVHRDGLWVVLSDYLDEEFGVIHWYSGAGWGIRPGWQLADGTNGTPDLRGRFIMCVDEDGLPSENEIGDSGGFRWHGTTENNHDTHAAHVIDDHAAWNHPEHVHCAEDDGWFVNTVGGADRLGDGKTADNPSADWCQVQWFYKTGFEGGVEGDQSTWYSTGVRQRTNGDTNPLTLSHAALVHAGSLTHMPHTDTDNRPRYYVLAAIVRIDNSGGEPP